MHGPMASGATKGISEVPRLTRIKQSRSPMKVAIMATTRATAELSNMVSMTGDARGFNEVK